MKVGWCDLWPPSLLTAPFEPLKGVRCEKPKTAAPPLLLLWALSGKLRSPFSTRFKCCGVRRSRGPVEVVQAGIEFHSFTRPVWTVFFVCVCESVTGKESGAFVVSLLKPQIKKKLAVMIKKQLPTATAIFHTPLIPCKYTSQYVHIGTWSVL